MSPRYVTIRHMKNRMWKPLTESIGTAAAAILLGIYLASNTSHLPFQLVMMSFPPASLWWAIRRNQPVTQPIPGQISASDSSEIVQNVAVAQAIEIEHLIQAS